MTESGSPASLTDELRSLLGDDADAVQDDYQKMYDWMLREGKNPRRKMGLAEPTALNYMPRLDQLYRMMVTNLDPADPTRITKHEADELLRALDQGEITRSQGDGEYADSAMRKFSDVLEKYFQWLYHDQEAVEDPWTPNIKISDGDDESADEFTYQELGLVFDEAHTHASLPSYYDTPTEERERINSLVAQRLGIRKDEVTKEDWLAADWSRKIYSLVLIGYSAGLAPKEVGAAKIDWYDEKTQTLRIPSAHACKERKKEKVALSDEAADALTEWIKHRRHLAKYDGTRKIWLNQRGNPYGSANLCDLIGKLCEQAGIETEERKIVWYSLRKTMGRNVTSEGGLDVSNDQLRHERLKTTQEDYNKTPIEEIQAHLNETHKKAARAKEDPDYNPFEEDEAKPREADAGSVETTTREHPTDDVVTDLGGGDVHADVRFEDTTSARVDIVMAILDGIDNEDADEATGE